MMLPFSKLKRFELNAFDGRIGQARDFYVTDKNWTVRYLIARFGSWLSEHRVLLPVYFVDRIQSPENAIAVALTKLQVRHAAPVESKRLVSKQHRLDVRLKFRELAGSVLRVALRQDADSYAAFKNNPPARREDGEDCHLNSCEELTAGYTLSAVDGRVGSIADLIIDDHEWRVRYLVVETGVLFSRKLILVPARLVHTISFAKHEILFNAMRSSLKTVPAIITSRNT